MGERTGIAARLAAEKVRYMGTLELLGGKLKDSIDTDTVEGSVTPSRDWCRAFMRYQSGLADLTGEQLKVAQLQMLRERMGGGTLTDEEYELGMAELAAESIKAMDIEVLQKALEERGLKVESVDDGEAE